MRVMLQARRQEYFVRNTMKHRMKTWVRVVVGLLGLAGVFALFVAYANPSDGELNWILEGGLLALALLGSALFLHYAYTGGGVEIRQEMLLVDKLYVRQIAKDDIKWWTIDESYGDEKIVINLKSYPWSLSIEYRTYRHPDKLREELVAFLNEEKRGNPRRRQPASGKK